MPSGSLYLKDQKNEDGEYFLAPAYDHINTCIHIQSGSDLGLMDGLSPDRLPGDRYLADRKAKDITLVRLCPSMTVRTVQLENMLRKQGFRAL